jgi:2-iminobutanoate/2-iminopropanoate deaminase
MGESMPKKVVNTGSALGPYSSAVVAGDTCYVAGTGGFVPGTTRIVEGGIEAEIRQTMKNLESTITQAGFRLQDVVSTTCYLRHIEHWPLLNDVYSGYFGHEPPARAAVVVGDMPAGANIEITCVAWRGKDD